MSPALAQAYAEWRPKLAASGFVDLEDPRTGELKGPYSHRQVSIDAMSPGLLWTLVQKYTDNARRRVDYYTRAEHFGTTHTWRTRKGSRDQEIWSLYAQGQSVRQIAAALSLHPTPVQRRIAALRKEFLNTTPKDSP